MYRFDISSAILSEVSADIGRYFQELCKKKQKLVCFFWTHCRMSETINHDPHAAVHRNAAIFEIVRAFDYILLS